MRIRAITAAGGFLVFAGLFLCGCAATSFHITDWPQEPYPVAQKKPPASFWEAAQVFDTTGTTQAASTPDEIHFAKALRATVENRSEKAVALAESLCVAHVDSVLHHRSRELLESALMSTSRWQDLADLYARDSLFNDSANSIRPLIDAFAAAPAQQIEFPPLPFAIPAELNAPGLVLIEVRVNGHRKKFILDTGASFTVLSSDFARECGIAAIQNKKTTAGTSTTRKVGIEPAIIDSLSIGKLVFRNHPAVIIQSSDLRFRLFGFLTLFEIDGIIGWNAIRETELQIDYPNQLVRIREPEQIYWNPPDNFFQVRLTTEEIPMTFNRNLFECNQPLLSLTSTAGYGTRCHFFLDTGSNLTSITDNYLKRIHRENLPTRTSLIGGAGGMQTYKAKVLPADTFVSSNGAIEARNLRTQPSMSDGFFLRDGVIGGDILQNGSILIDRLNGRCEILSESESVITSR